MFYLYHDFSYIGFKDATKFQHRDGGFMSLSYFLSFLSMEVGLEWCSKFVMVLVGGFSCWVSTELFSLYMTSCRI